MGRTRTGRGVGGGGFPNSGRKTLIGGRRGHSGGRVHSRINGHSGGTYDLTWAQQQNGLHGGNSVGTDQPVGFGNLKLEFPYEVRLNGFSTVLETLKGATEDVHKLVMEECDIILECRICRNLFRSLPNYLKHKLMFCTEKFQKISPGGLSQLMKLANDSFNINGGTKLSFENPKTPPDTSTPPAPKSNHEEASDEEEDNQNHDNVSETVKKEENSLDFDLNNVVPMLTRATNMNSKRRNGLKLHERLNPQHEASSDELRLLDNTATYQGNPRARNVNVQAYENSIAEGGNYKPVDTAILAPDGKIAYMGQNEVVKEIVARVFAEVKRDQKEKKAKLKALTCTVCKTLFDTDKSLRTHMRSHAVIHERPPKKKKSLTATALAASDTTESKASTTEIQPQPDDTEELAVENPVKKSKEKPTPSTSKSSVSESTKTGRPDPSVNVNVHVHSSKPSTKSTLPSDPPPTKVQTAELKSLSPSASLLLFANGSDKPTTGRRTNNSFSARLNTTPLSTLLPSLPPVDISPASPPSSGPKKRSNEKSAQGKCGSQIPEKKARVSNEPNSSEYYECSKCSMSFEDKSAMSKHLVFCGGSMNLVLSTPDGQVSKKKIISIIDRKEYEKTETSGMSPSSSGMSPSSTGMSPPLEATVPLGNRGKAMDNRDFELSFENDKEEDGSSKDDESETTFSSDDDDEEDYIPESSSSESPEKKIPRKSHEEPKKSVTDMDEHKPNVANDEEEDKPKDNVDIDVDENEQEIAKDGKEDKSNDKVDIDVENEQKIDTNEDEELDKSNDNDENEPNMNLTLTDGDGVSEVAATSPMSTADSIGATENDDNNLVKNDLDEMLELEEDEVSAQPDKPKPCETCQIA